jgi:hypothetical protein
VVGAFAVVASNSAVGYFRLYNNASVGVAKGPLAKVIAIAAGDVRICDVGRNSHFR